MKITSETLETLKRFASTMTRNEMDAQDLVADTLETAAKMKHNGKSSLETWLYAIMSNIYRRYKKDAIRLHNLTTNSDGSAFGVYEIPETYDHEYLIKKVNQLPKRQKECLMMFAEGYSYKDIAKKLKISVGSVERRIFEARENMKKYKSLFI